MEELNKCLRSGTKWDNNYSKKVPIKFFNFSNIDKFLKILQMETNLRKDINFAFMYDRARYAQKIHLVKSDNHRPNQIKHLVVNRSITEVHLDDWEKIINFLTT